MIETDAAETHREDEAPGLLARTLDRALVIDPEGSKQRALKVLQGRPGEDNARKTALRLVNSYSWKAGGAGFVTGVESNPLIAVPAALGDMMAMLHFYARLTAEVGFLADPHYFEDPQWRVDAYATLFGPKVLAQMAREIGLPLAKGATKVLMRKYVTDEALVVVRAWILKRLGKRITARGIATKLVPVVGGIVGGLWNFAEIRIIGKWIIQYHFPVSEGGAENRPATD
jgi:hypothetical protein